MNETFYKVDINTWSRRDEYEFFTNGGCGFTLTADIDITNLYDFSHKKKVKFYPLLVSVMMQVVNGHKEFRYGNKNNEFGYYEVMHPLFFDAKKDGSPRSLCAEYKKDILEQVNEIEKVRKLYSNSDKYRPQEDMPQNIINISCVPWVKFTSASFSLKYCATYYPPIITFGKYEKKDNKVIIPLSVYCNHAVNDGYHCSMMINEFEKFANELK